MSGLYTPFGRAARWVVRRALGPWTVQALEETPASAVFLVHHQNLFGPIHAMAFLPREVRLWVLSPFCDRKACFEQYYGYTFTRRFGWPRPAAWAVSRLLSFLLPGFLRQFRVIPVWRGSLDIRDTLRQSQEALAQGQSLLICPDQDYASNEDEVGALYSGFLHLERPYYKVTGEHLPFVPLCCRKEDKTLVIGRALSFTGGKPFRQERDELAQALAGSMNDLARSARQDRR